MPLLVVPRLLVMLSAGVAGVSAAHNAFAPRAGHFTPRVPATTAWTSLSAAVGNNVAIVGSMPNIIVGHVDDFLREPPSTPRCVFHCEGMVLAMLGLPGGGLVAAGRQFIYIWEDLQVLQCGAKPDRTFNTSGEVTSLLLIKEGSLVAGLAHGSVEVWDNFRTARSGAQPTRILRASAAVNSLLEFPWGGMAVGTGKFEGGASYPVDIWLDVGAAKSGDNPSLVLSAPSSVRSLVALSDGGLAAGTACYYECSPFVCIWHDVANAQNGSGPAVLLTTRDTGSVYEGTSEIADMIPLPNGGLAAAIGVSHEEAGVSESGSIVIWADVISATNTTRPNKTVEYDASQVFALLSLPRGEGIAAAVGRNVDMLLNLPPSVAPVYSHSLSSGAPINTMISLPDNSIGVGNFEGVAIWPSPPVYVEPVRNWTLAPPGGNWSDMHQVGCLQSLPQGGLAVGATYLKGDYTLFAAVSVWPNSTAVEKIGFPPVTFPLPDRWNESYRDEVAVTAILVLPEGGWAVATSWQMGMMRDNCFGYNFFIDIWPSLAAAANKEDPEVTLSFRECMGAVRGMVPLPGGGLAAAVEESLLVWPLTVSKHGTLAPIRWTPGNNSWRDQVTSVVLLANGGLAVGTTHSYDSEDILFGHVFIWPTLSSLVNGAEPAIMLNASFGVETLLSLPSGGVAAGTQGTIDIWLNEGAMWQDTKHTIRQAGCTSSFSVFVNGAITCDGVFYTSIPTAPGKYTPEFELDELDCPHGWRSIAEQGACWIPSGFLCCIGAVIVCLTVAIIWCTGNGMFRSLVCQRRFASVEFPMSHAEIWHAVLALPAQRSGRCLRPRMLVRRALLFASTFAFAQLSFLGLAAFTFLQSIAQLRSMRDINAARGPLSALCMVSSLQCCVSCFALAAIFKRLPPCVVQCVDRYSRVAITLKDIALGIKFLILSMPLGHDVAVMDVAYFWQCESPSLCPTDCTGVLEGVCTIDYEQHQCLCLPSVWTWQKTVTIANCIASAVLTVGSIVSLNMKSMRSTDFTRRNPHPFPTLVAASVLPLSASLLIVLFTWHLADASSGCKSFLAVAGVTLPVLCFELLSNEIKHFLLGFVGECNSYTALKTDRHFLVLKPLCSLVAMSIVGLFAWNGLHQQSCGSIWLHLAMGNMVMGGVAAMCIARTGESLPVSATPLRK